MSGRKRKAESSAVITSSPYKTFVLDKEMNKKVKTEKTTAAKKKLVMSSAITPKPANDKSKRSHKKVGQSETPAIHQQEHTGRRARTTPSYTKPRPQSERPELPHKPSWHEKKSTSLSHYFSTDV